MSLHMFRLLHDNVHDESDHQPWQPYCCHPVVMFGTIRCWSALECQCNHIYVIAFQATALRHPGVHPFEDLAKCVQHHHRRAGTKARHAIHATCHDLFQFLRLVDNIRELGACIYHDFVGLKEWCPLPCSARSSAWAIRYPALHT